MTETEGKPIATISIIICTHDPAHAVLAQTLAALAQQRGVAVPTELIVIDNRSATPFDDVVARQPGLDARVVREDRLGLTHARIRGLRESTGEIIVMVDDDNVLDPDYLANVAAILGADAALGAIGGKSIPRFAAPPPLWFTIEEFSLGCRDLGDVDMRATWRGLAPGDRFYPPCAPIGGGMAIRRAAFEAYVAKLEGDASRSALDRRGQSLSSGGDNDMVLCALEAGFDIGYFARLTLHHLIPAGRVQPDYLARYQHDSTKTWVEVLDLHGISPWRPIAPWTLPLRQARAWLRMRAWASELDRIRWRGACGIFAGRAAIARNSAR